MSLWASSVLGLLLLQTVQVQAQQANDESRPVAIDEVAAPSVERPRPLVLVKRDWNLTQAYSDVFKILSDQNPCSNFYGGPRAATTVFNDFVSRVKPQPLDREVSFQMVGRPRIFHNMQTGAWYRRFDKTMGS